MPVVDAPLGVPIHSPRPRVARKRHGLVVGFVDLKAWNPLRPPEVVPAVLRPTATPAARRRQSNRCANAPVEAVAPRPPASLQAPLIAAAFVHRDRSRAVSLKPDGGRDPGLFKVNTTRV